MKLHRPRPRRDNEAHLIPLINIVFLLLIFFMLTARLNQPEPFEIDPPTSASANPAEPRELTVLIAADGRLAVGEQALDENALRELVSVRLDEQGQTELKVKADARVDTHRLIEVMEILRSAGAEKLILLTALGDA